MRFTFGLLRQRYFGGGVRGMDFWHDLVGLVGGFLFEVSKADEVLYFFRQRGFSLSELKTCACELGCNKYVFPNI